MFLIRVMRDGQPVLNAKAEIHEPGFWEHVLACAHTANGWYEADSLADHAEVFVNDECYGERRSTATINL